MEDLKDVVYLDAEIIEDDEDAPVGTLVNADVATVAPVADTAQDAPATDEAPVVEVEEAPADEPVEAPAEEPAEAPTDEPVAEPVAETVAEEKVENEPAPVVEEVKPKKTAKAKLIHNEDSKPVDTSKINLGVNLKNQKTVQNELFGTKFEIEQPKKTAPVVSTKKKQEKAEDIWAVASVAQRKAPQKPTAPIIPTPKPAPAPKKKAVKPAPADVAPVVEQPKTEPKKAPKAAKQVPPTPSTQQVENTKPIKSTEEKKKVAEEKVIDWIVEPTEKYAGTYIIKKTDKGNFVFKLFAYNKNCLAIGAQPYTSVAGCKGGINSIINNAATAPVINCTLKDFDPKAKLPLPRWEVYQDKKGEFRLRLYASNGNLVATTNDGYMQVAGAKKGIESIAKASVGCGIRRDDNLW